MTVAVGSLVSPSVLSSDLAYAQGRIFGMTAPVFGKITAYAAPNASILWTSGLIQTAVPNTVFDEILDPVGSTDLLGTKVRIANQNVALDMVVVQIYARRDGEESDPAFDVALCLCLNTPGPMYREFLPADLTAA